MLLSDDMSLAGANLIFNLSASSEYVGKQSLKKKCYLRSFSKTIGSLRLHKTGHYESSSETVFSSHKVIAALGDIVRALHLLVKKPIYTLI